MAQVFCYTPTDRLTAVLHAIDKVLVEQLPPVGDHKAEPGEVIMLALYYLRNAARCLQRSMDCETFTDLAHQAYHRAEEMDLEPEELALKRYEVDDDEPRH
jgi:hypothetical protein